MSKSDHINITTTLNWVFVINTALLSYYCAWNSLGKKSLTLFKIQHTTTKFHLIIIINKCHLSKKKNQCEQEHSKTIINVSDVYH